MLKLGRLTITGVIAGLVLAGSMKFIFLLTGNEAYQLLYNVDYIPLIRVYDNTAYFGLFFHYLFCIISVIGVYYFLKVFHLHDKPALYIIIYTGGAGLLFFLTLLTNDPPTANHFVSWLYWTGSHLVFSIIVAFLVQKWV